MTDRNEGKPTQNDDDDPDDRCLDTRHAFPVRLQIEQRHNRDDDQSQEFGGFWRDVFAKEQNPCITAEREGHHDRDDLSDHVKQPGHDPGHVPVAKPLHKELDRSPLRGVSGAELGEGVALQHRDHAGDQEGKPHRTTSNGSRFAKQREDASSHHRADAQEGSVKDPYLTATVSLSHLT